MKHVVFLGDGMADCPLDALAGRTPLDAAEHPAMDAIARRGTLGLARTVPDGMPAGSDVANLSVLGYDPALYYSGRSPFEALAMGIGLAPEDVTYRCNLVTLSESAALEDARMLDYSAGEIDTETARENIRFLAGSLARSGVELYPGVSYRHCLVLRAGQTGAVLTPPHDITGQPLRAYLPSGTNCGLLNGMIRFAYENLPKLGVNRALAERGRPAPNAVWFWGEGRKPSLPSFFERYGLRGAMISAVDLLHGIARCAGMESIPVEGATGNFHTDFAAKGKAAIQAFRDGFDLVYIHVEAADECGHHGQIKEKIYSIEQIDRKVVAPVMAYLEGAAEGYAALLMPDHPTPIATMTHSADPVPFAIARRGEARRQAGRFTEREAERSGLLVPEAHRLMGMLTGNPTCAGRRE